MVSAAYGGSDHLNVMEASIIPERISLLRNGFRFLFVTYLGQQSGNAEYRIQTSALVEHPDCNEDLSLSVAPPGYLPSRQLKALQHVDENVNWPSRMAHRGNHLAHHFALNGQKQCN